MIDNSPSWLMLVAPFGLVVYLTVLLGFLWLAVRVVRHAWYWGSASQKAPSTAEQGGPNSSGS
jgi:hypothetical protein